MAHEYSKRQIYDNCAAVDADGKVLFLCERRRMTWYLDRGLAELVEQDPPKFKLLFTPLGTGHSGDPFFIIPRKSICVVCGTTERLTRHHILPHCYRRFFPKSLNRYGSYDVVALCVTHHNDYEIRSEELRSALAAEYDAPVNGLGGRADPVLGNGIRAAYALNRHSDQIPPARRDYLTSRVRAVFGRDEVSDDELNGLRWGLTSPHIPHAKMVVEKLNGYEELGRLIVRWRKHFIEVMTPAYMPENWEIDRVFDGDAR